MKLALVSTAACALALSIIGTSEAATSYSIITYNYQQSYVDFFCFFWGPWLSSCQVKPTRRPTPPTRRTTTTTRRRIPTTTRRTTTTTRRPITTTKRPVTSTKRTTPVPTPSYPTTLDFKTTIYFESFFLELGTTIRDAYGSLFVALNAMNRKRAYDEPLAGWMPPYLAAFDIKVQTAFKKMRDQTIRGITAGEYFYILPECMKTLIKNADADRKTVSIHIIDEWRATYQAMHAEWNADVTDAQHQTNLYLNLKNRQEIYNMITVEEVDYFSTADIIQLFRNDIIANKAETGHVWAGLGREFLNPLYYSLRDTPGLNIVNCIKRLVGTYSEMTTEVLAGRDISAFVPATLEDDLRVEGATDAHVTSMMATYKDMRAKMVPLALNYKKAAPRQSFTVHYFPNSGYFVYDKRF